MIGDIFEELELLRHEVEACSIEGESGAEQFRQLYLGSKNKLKPLFSRITEVEASRKKEFGQRINSIKQLAEERFEAAKQNASTSGSKMDVSAPDMSLPARDLSSGSKHPITLVMDRIVSIFGQIGFEVAEDREIAR